MKTLKRATCVTRVIGLPYLAHQTAQLLTLQFELREFDRWGAAHSLPILPNILQYLPSRRFWLEHLLFHFDF